RCERCFKGQNRIRTWASRWSTNLPQVAERSSRCTPIWKRPPDVYTITFYSFKGGVGRTFALVNVAAELARRGRRVLLVDFDLEAPGLETFERLRPSEPHPGVVEYVKDYMLTKQPPDVRKYIYSAGM